MRLRGQFTMKSTNRGGIGEYSDKKMLLWRREARKLGADAWDDCILSLDGVCRKYRERIITLTMYQFINHRHHRVERLVWRPANKKNDWIIITFQSNQEILHHCCNLMWIYPIEHVNLALTHIYGKNHWNWFHDYLCVLLFYSILWLPSSSGDRSLRLITLSHVIRVIPVPGQVCVKIKVPVAVVHTLLLVLDPW